MKKHNKLTKMYSLYASMSIPLKASIWYLICNVLQKAIGFITTPIFTRVMSADDFGVIAVYNSWESIITVIATLYLYNGVYNNAMIEFKNDRDSYTSSMQGFTTLLTCIWMVFYFVFRKYLFTTMGMSDFVMLLMFIDIIFTTGMSFWSIRNRYEYKYKSVVIFTLVSSLCMPILSLLLVLNTSSYKAEARIVGMVVVNVMVYGIVYFENFKRGKKIFSKKYWKYSVLFNLPLIPHYLSSSIFTQLDKIMINSMCGIALSGVYSIANSVSSIMNIFTISINQAITPWVFEKLDKKETKEIGEVTYAIIVFMGVGFILIALLSPELIGVLAPKEYQNAKWASTPLLMGAYLYFIYCNFGNVEIFYHRQKDMLTSSLLVVVLNVILNFVLIKKYGFIAASYATMISYFVYALLHYLFMKRVCTEKKENNPFNGILIFGTAFIVVIISLLSMLLYNASVLRYTITILLLVIILCILLKNRVRILKIIRNN